MRDLLRSYTAPDGRFNEVQDPTGALRPDWENFVTGVGALAPNMLASLQQRVSRQLHENGVTYNVQSAGSPARAWALDILPHLVSATEWDRIASGLRQRARLLEAIVRDLYGPQRLLARGLVPPAVVFGHHGFMHVAHGVTPPGGTFLHLLAFDLGRTPTGDWRVLSTRAQAPSGAGYTLENRLTVSRLFPDAFRDQHVQRLAPFFRSLQETLLANAPAHGTTPHIVLLTPGRYNETYFEHAYLSRYLGFTLVEGADLTVRNDAVFLKTVGGLRPVHVILRRMDDDFCDPLELRADSALGVPGLVNAWRRGNVLVANAFGAGVLESPALAAFLPAISEAVLGESLALRSTEAWWCGETDVLPMAEQRLRELVVKPVVDAGTAGPIFGGILNERELAEWRERLREWPERYVVEEFVPLSHSPVWQDDHLESRAVLMRVFLTFDGHGDYRVLPGGLTRIGNTDGVVVSGQRGGGSKDTWVLSHAPVPAFSLLPGRIQAPDVTRGERAVSSRSAEHLFWMGRYAERSENAARLLRAVLTRLPQGDASVSTSSPPVIGACRRLDLVPPDLDPAEAAAHDYERALIAGISDPVAQHGLAFNVGETLRVASTVRDRLSSDNWRILNQLSETLSGRNLVSSPLADALELLDHAIISLVAVGGLEMAHMTRDDGWRFMSLGRHLERVLYVIATTTEVAASPMAEDPALLEWLLDLSDSIITYRARYMGHAEWTAVADLLLFDRTNPRSAAFQLSKLAKHVPQLPGGELGDIGARLAALAVPTGVLPQPDAIAEYLARTEQLVRHLSDLLTLRYFSHVYEPAHATLI